jgi:16S rRNA (uracil1498-N3)-methyltransferase
VTPPLFLVPTLPDGLLLVLDGDEGRHATKVKRIGVGEQISIGDGRGNIADCTVTALAGEALHAEVNSRRTVPAHHPQVVVVQALPKGDRAELAVEMLTGLGADEIVPWAASRSISRWEGARAAKSLEKWQRTAREATKQSRRAWIPRVGPLASTADVAARIRAAGSFTAVVLHEGAAIPLATTPLAERGELFVVVGPEGGIASAELEQFAAAGAAVVRLGEPVLRTSTAGAAALAVLSTRLGRWG